MDLKPLNCWLKCLATGVSVFTPLLRDAEQTPTSFYKKPFHLVCFIQAELQLLLGCKMVHVELQSSSHTLFNKKKQRSVHNVFRTQFLSVTLKHIVTLTKNAVIV
ncbi:hypothetical protein CHARACLAT_007181 [Characodon lateralis]|uniref:Uncharacterized protein n=1 Tax=Characodon lateralis TaxID=208331 RepID=A0ABU7E7S2_9TELE|nr:hypothetical protein [Characodon lateralis]